VLRPVILLIAVLGAVSLLPATQSQGATGPRKVTIQVLSVTRVSIPHDLAPKGRENRGDYLEFKDLLVTIGPLFGRKHKNEPVGWDQGTQTYTNTTDARMVGVATFPGQGLIRFKGMMKPLPKGANSVPVVGGTGKFSGARGVLVMSAGQDKSVNTFHLVLRGDIA
jgi:hypothetical protein